MSVMVDERVAALSRAHAEVDVLLGCDTAFLPTEELLASWRELERLRNRLAAVEHRFVAEAESRGLPGEFGARDVPALIRGLLRVAPGDARARVRAADAAVSRTAVSGALQPAPFAEVAAAQVSGAISPRHAAVVVRAIESLPEALQATHGARVEQDLVGYAHEFDPHELGRLATRTVTLLDQDGALRDVAYRERHRDLTIRQRPDGSAAITCEATAELAERLLAVLDPLAAPRPEADGVKDTRTAGQRRHDAVLDALDLLQRAEVLPTVNGIGATVLLTMTVDAWTTGDGVATTGHGAIIPAREAIRIAGGDCRTMTVTLDEFGGIVDYTDTRRFFAPLQRLAMTARDGGCTFPGCDAPPAWCQAHHLRDHAKGGTTTVDDGALVCGHHHRTAIAAGWVARMTDNLVAWIPPPWIDPDQRPRFNRLHELT